MTLLVGAVATLPVGMLVDRTKRIPMLSLSIVLWSFATLLSAFAGSYSTLLLTRLLLGAVVATAGPAIASLTGDYFPARERGRIYAYILGGEIGRHRGRLHRLGQRRGRDRLARGIRAAVDSGVLPGPRAVPHRARSRCAAARVTWSRGRRTWWRRRPVPARVPPRVQAPARTGSRTRRRHRPRTWLSRRRGGWGWNRIPKLVLTKDPRTLSMAEAVRYTLSIRSNVIMIISSSLGYFFFSGLTTFALLFVRGHYGANAFTSDLVLALLVMGALFGTLVSGWLGGPAAASRHARQPRLATGDLLPRRRRAADPRLHLHAPDAGDVVRRCRGGVAVGGKPAARRSATGHHAGRAMGTGGEHPHGGAFAGSGARAAACSAGSRPLIAGFYPTAGAARHAHPRGQLR